MRTQKNTVRALPPRKQPSPTHPDALPSATSSPPYQNLIDKERMKRHNAMVIYQVLEALEGEFESVGMAHGSDNHVNGAS